MLPCMDISALNTTNDIEKLRAMALAMVQEVMSENAEKERELLEKSRRIQLLEEMLKLVRQQRFGKKCGTLAGMQRSLFEEDVDADIAALTAHLDKLLPQSPEEDEKASRSRPIRKPLPVHLPRVEKIIQPDTDHCPECDEPLHYIRDAVSEKLEYIPAHFVVNRYVRPQYSCPCCQKVFSGEMPAHILPKSAVEPSVIAQVIINKYGDHLPLYRQQQVFARSDVGLPVSSMADMVGAAGAALSPLAALLHRELINRPVVHADETTLKILNTKKGGKSCSGYLWAYVSGERTGPSVVCFDCRTGRSHEYPENWLQGWGGTLVVDGHKAYRTLANKVPELANIIGHHAGIDDNTAAKAIAHAILGGVTAALQGNSAAAGAIGAGTGEVISSAIAKSLYPDVDPSKLTEDQKQTVSTLATLSAGMAGGIASGDVAGTAAGAGVGKNIAENNLVGGTESEQSKAAQTHGADVLSCNDAPGGEACKRGEAVNKAYAGALATGSVALLPGGAQAMWALGTGANAGIGYMVDSSVDPENAIIAGWVNVITMGQGWKGTVGWNAAGGALGNWIDDKDPLSGALINGTGSGIGYGVGKGLSWGVNAGENWWKGGWDPKFNSELRSVTKVKGDYGLSKEMKPSKVPSSFGDVGGSAFSEITGKGIEKISSSNANGDKK